MMAAHDEETAIRRVETLARARELCKAWGYWCWYGQWGSNAGQRPFVTGVHGGPERRYKAPPQWYPAEPKFPEADENVGLAVQKAYVHLPDIRGFRFRTILKTEFCLRPWIIGLREGEIEESIARKARVSIGSYDVVLDRALLALSNVMKQKGLWR